MMQFLRRVARNWKRSPLNKILFARSPSRRHFSEIALIRGGLNYEVAVNEQNIEPSQQSDTTAGLLTTDVKQIVRCMCVSELTAGAISLFPNSS